MVANSSYFSQLKQGKQVGLSTISTSQMLNELKAILDPVAYNNLGVCCFNIILDSKKKNNQNGQLEREIAQILCDMPHTSSMQIG